MPDANQDIRIITRENGRSREIAALHRTPENEAMTDEELFAELDEWKRNRRHLRAVEDE
ncbi:hypothetical protein ACIRJS_32885 [Streptomyces sp. NPDC102340]|uniref:hypothetical protein n=1 Tax=unclassified Streptomyces TaxID=2593676 RepID=UPI0037F2983D